MLKFFCTPHTYTETLIRIFTQRISTSSDQRQLYNFRVRLAVQHARTAACCKASVDISQDIILCYFRWEQPGSRQHRWLTQKQRQHTIPATIEDIRTILAYGQRQGTLPWRGFSLQQRVLNTIWFVRGPRCSAPLILSRTQFKSSNMSRGQPRGLHGALSPDVLQSVLTGVSDIYLSKSSIYHHLRTCLPYW